MLDFQHINFYRIAPATLVLTLGVILSSCIHWPGEPYMDSVDNPSKEVRAIFAGEYPKAGIIGPVYRRHLDTNRGDRIDSRFFLFRDTDGKAYRGFIDRESRMTASKISFVSKLPGALKTKFFNSPSLPSGPRQIEGRPWIISGPDPFYEFRFTSKIGPGLGRISKSGKSISAYHLRD